MSDTPSSGGTNIEMLGLGLDTSGLSSAAKDVDNFIDKEIKAVDATEKLETSSKSASASVKELGNTTTQTAGSVEELVAATNQQAKNLVRLEDVIGSANKSAREQLRLAQEQYEIDRAALQLKADAAKRMNDEAAAGGILIARLNEMVNSYGKTREELLRLQAAQLGVSAAAEPLIQSLERQGKSLTQVEYSANRTMEALDKLNERNRSQKEYSTMASMQAEEAASLRRQENRKKDNKDLEVYTRNEIESSRRRASAAEYAANAQMIANDQATKNRSRAAAERVKSAEKEALEEIRWSRMSGHAKQDEIAKLKAYQARGISQSTIDSTFSKAAQQAARDGQTFGNVLRDISFNSSRARAELIVLAHEMVTGRFTRIPGSMMVLAEYTNMSALAMSGLGLAALGLVGGLVAYTVALAGAEAQNKKLNDAINRTNSASGVTRESLQDMANAAGKLNGNYGDAYNAAAKLAGSGKFSADQLRQIIPVVTEMEMHFNDSLPTSIQEFESLVVRASTKGIQSALGVSRALLDLNDKYHFLNMAQLDEIITMERAGKVREASALAIDLYGKEQKRVVTEAKEYMGNLEKMWHGIAGAIGRAKQSLMDWGKTQTPDQARKAILVPMIERLKDPKAEANLSDNARVAMLGRAQAELTKIIERENAANQKALEIGEKRRIQDEALGIMRRRQIENDTRLKRTQTESDKAIEKFNNENKLLETAQPGFMKKNAKDLEDMRQAILREHAPRKGPKDPQPGEDLAYFRIDTKKIDADFRLAQEAVADNERILKSALSSKVLSEKVAYEQMEQNRDEELRALEVWYNKRAALLEKDGKKLKATERAKVRSELDDEYENKYNDITGAKGKNAADRVNDEQKEYDKLTKSIETANEKEIDRIDKAIAKQKEKNETIGLTDEQKELALSRMYDDMAAQNELEAENLRIKLESAGVSEDPRAIQQMKDRLAHLNTLIGKEKEYAALKLIGADREKNSPEKMAKDADKLAKSWKQAGQSIGENLEKAFGKAGKSASNMFKAFAEGQSRQLELNKQLILEKAAAKGTDDEQFRTKQAQDKYNADTARNRMNEYGEMAGAAASFFGEQSKGYQALMTMSQVFHAAELAMTIAELVPKATAAVLNQGSGDPYTAFARMASMAAIVAGLGVAVGSIGGGDSSENRAKDRQAAAGTGSVFGDDKAKSESIARSLEHLEKDSNLGLVHSAQMVNSLRTIANSVSGLTNVALRGGSINQDMGIITGKTDKAKEGAALGAAMGSVVPMFGTILGAIGGWITGKLTSVSTSIVDQGLKFDSAAYKDLTAGGVRGVSYADVNVKKKALGFSYSNKTSTRTAELDSEIENQFTLVIKSIGEGVNAAADVLGIGGDAFKSKLDSFVVSIGEMSTKGKTGKEIEEQFQSIFGKLADDMAKYSLDGLDQFNKAGEGYFETSIRLANDLSQVKDVFAVMGVEFNKTGMDALKFSQDLINSYGGVEELTSAVSTFVDSFYTEAERLKPISESVNRELTRLGVSVDVSKTQFKDLATSMLNGTVEGSNMYAAMMKIAPALAEIRDAEVELANEKRGILTDIANLERNGAEVKRLVNEARKVELDAMDASLRPLKERLWALEDESAVYDQKLSMLTKVAELEKNDAEFKRLTAEARQNELSMMDETLRPIQERIWALEDEAEAVKKAEKAADDAAKAADKVAKAIEKYKDAMESVTKGLDDGMSKALDQVKVQVDKNKDALVERYEAEVKAYNESIKAQEAVIEAKKKEAKDAVDAAKTQLDAAKTVRDGIKSIFDDLTSAIKSTEIESAAMDRARRKEAQAYLKSVSGTDLTKATGLGGALDTLAKDSKGLFTNFVEYAVDQAKTSSIIGQLRGQSAETMSTAELQVKASEYQIELMELESKKLDEQSKQLQEISKDHLDTMKQNHEDAMKREDAIFEIAKLQVEGLRGINTSVLSLGEALSNLNVATSSYQAQSILAAGPTGTTGVDGVMGTGGASADSAINSIYNNLLGRNAESEGLRFWTDRLKEGVNIAEITHSITNSKEYKDIIESRKQNQYANMLEEWYKKTPGLAIGTNEVTEDGIMKLHKGERVMPAADNRQLMSQLSKPDTVSRAVVSELRELRKEVVYLRESNTRENTAIQKDTGVSANKLKRIETTGVAIRETAQ